MNWLYEQRQFSQMLRANFVDELLSGLLDLSCRRREPLTHELAGQLRSLIATGRLKPGHRLASSRAMARSLGISRNTVSLAIEQLAAEGYLSTARSRRPVVAEGVSLLTGERGTGGAQTRSLNFRLSRWAHHISGSVWPPTYDGRPRAFQPGLADEREFPYEAWGRSLRGAVSNAARRNRAHNNPALQESLLNHLAEHRGIKALPEAAIIVPSAQAGISLIANVMINAGDTAWIESPGYGGAFAALRSVNAKVIGVPIDAGGLMIARHRKVPRIIFVTPSHQYPSGRLMPVGRRLELLQFADSTGAIIVEDDYDGEFHYEGRPVAALTALAPNERTIYLGTFSKAMTADIRVGYLIVPERLVPTFALAQRHLGLLVAVALQAALADFIAAGDYRTHVRRMTRLYRARRDQLASALAMEAGERLLVDIPAGGMQLLATCNPSVDDVALSRRLGQDGVITRPLSEMLYHRSRQRGLFLGFAAWNDTEIADGARAIGKHIRDRRYASL